MKSRTVVALKVLITAGLIYFLYRSIDFNRMVSVLRSATLWPLLLATAVTIFNYLLGSVRWRMILGAFDVRAPIGKVAQMVLMGGFFSVFLPTLIGGDVVKSFYLARERARPFTTILTTTLLERSVGYIGLLLIGTVGSWWTSLRIQGVWVFPFFLAGTLAFCLAFWILLHPGVHPRISAFVERRGWQRVATRLEPILTGLQELGRKPKILLSALCLSIVLQALSVVVTWLVARALHVNAPFHLFLIFVPIISTVAMLPLTPGSVGLKEATFCILLKQVNASCEAGVLISLLNHVVVIAAALPGGLLYSLYKRDEHFEPLPSEVKNA